jgi:hypothetical protein
VYTFTSRPRAIGENPKPAFHSRSWSATQAGITVGSPWDRLCG